MISVQNQNTNESEMDETLRAHFKTNEGSGKVKREIDLTQIDKSFDL